MPSPKTKVYVAMGLVPGVEPDASAATVSGVAPSPGDTDTAAFGAATTVTCTDAVAVVPPVSVTVRVTV